MEGAQGGANNAVVVVVEEGDALAADFAATGGRRGALKNYAVCVTRDSGRATSILDC
jgi:hypothetical protein